MPTSRVTSKALQSGTQRMYELLHETEHRLLYIQAGGTYLDHVKACKVAGYILLNEFEIIMQLLYMLAQTILRGAHNIIFSLPNVDWFFQK